MRPKSSTPNKQLGKLIRAHRQKLGLGLRTFASQAGTDYTTLLRLERGSDVRLSAFLKLARTHGFPFPPDMMSKT